MSTSIEIRPLIHIGYQKTGSTFLQDHVFHNRDFGFFSPGNDVRAQLMDNFVLVNPYRFDHGQARSVFADLLREAATDSLIPVLSDENLVGHPTSSFVQGPAIAERLRAAFPDGRILVCIREQKSVVLSLYSEHLRHSHTHDLETFIGNGKMPPGSLPIMRRDFYRYDELIHELQQRFGRDSVLVLPFERLKEPNTFVRRICEFALAEPRGELTVTESRTKPSHGGATLVCRRWLNFAAPKPDYTRSSQPLRFRAVRKSCEALDRFIPARLQSRALSRFRSLINERLSGEYRESNRRTSELIGIDLGELGYEM